MPCRLAGSWFAIVLISVCALMSCDGLGRAERVKEQKELSSKLEDANARIDQLSRQVAILD
jgi:outer membrane murein-binding lipoprotein Lpp